MEYCVDIYCYIAFHGIAAVYCKAGVVISKDQDLSNMTLDDLHKQGYVKDVVQTTPHLSSVQNWEEAIELYVITYTQYTYVHTYVYTACM